MKDRIAHNPESKRRLEYTRRILTAVNYKGSSDHEDVPSILCEFQNEIIKEYANKIVEQLREESSFVTEEGLELIPVIEAVSIVKKGGAV